MIFSRKVLRECPSCAEPILAKARVCKHCGRETGDIAVANVCHVALGSTKQYEEPRSATVEGELESDTAPDTTRLNGVEGWLALFAFGQFVAALVSVFGIYETLSSVRSYLGGLTLTDPALPRAFYTLASSLSLYGIGGATGFVLVVRRNRRAPTFCSLFLALAIVLAIVDSGASLLIADALRSAGRASDAETLSSSGLRDLVYAIGWLAYWHKSKRVLTTFGYNGSRPPGLTLGQAARETFAGVTLLPIAGMTAAVLATAFAATQPPTAGAQHRSNEGASAAAATDTSNNGNERLSRAYVKYLPVLDEVLPQATPGQRLGQFQQYQLQAQRGWHEIGDSLLIPYASALGYLYAAMPDGACAEYAGPNASRESAAAYSDALTSAPASVQDAFVSGYLHAIAADLAHAPRRYDNRRQVLSSLRQYQSLLQADDSSRLEKFIQFGLASATPDETCWAMRLFYGRMPRELPANEASGVLRWLRVYRRVAQFRGPFVS
jgi:hypothetical protein